MQNGLDSQPYTSLKDIKSGDVYNNWTAVRFDTRKGGALYWIFQCLCGKEVSVRAGNVVRGRSTKCMTCSRRERPWVELESGTKFGKWTAINLVRVEYKKGQVWLFRCDCGTEKEFLAAEARNGRTTQC